MATGFPGSVRSLGVGKVRTGSPGRYSPDYLDGRVALGHDRDEFFVSQHVLTMTMLVFASRSEYGSVLSKTGLWPCRMPCSFSSECSTALRR